MSELLIDNDIFYLLSAAGVLSDVLSLLDVATERIQVLPSLKNEKATRNRLRRVYSNEHIGQVLAATQAGGLQSITLQPDELQRIIELNNFENVDEGEATLLVRLSKSGDCILLATKDTRFVGALAESDFEEKNAAIGKIVLLEHVLAILYKQFGYGYISEHFMPCVDYDRRLCAILGTTGNVASFVEGLTSYIRKDIELYGGLLREFPVVEMPDA